MIFSYSNSLLKNGLMCLLGAWLAANVSAGLLTPEKGDKLSLLIGDKVSPYFKLAVDSSVYVTATGPGDLELLVRISFPAGSKDHINWKLTVEENGTTITSHDETVAASDAAWQESTARPGDGVKVPVTVPEGDHRYKVTLTSPLKSFAGIRYIMSADLAHEEKSAVYPAEMLGTTSIAVKAKVLDFFLADTVKPVKVKVIGPTRLRVVTRLAYSGTMKGGQLYSAVVSTDYGPEQRNPLQTFKATSSYFTNHKDWSVGESKTFYIDVPEGHHEVAVRLGSSTAPALAMRFTIPKEDIKH